MDEATTLILEGCRLARSLEANLPNIMANQEPAENENLHTKCNEIIGVFTRARDNVSRLVRHHQSQEGVHDWLHSNHTSAMDLLQSQMIMAPEPRADAKMKGVVVAQDQDESAGGTLAEVVGPRRLLGSGGDPAAPATATSDHRGEPSQRQRRRSDGGARRVELVPAPQMGNTDLSPEDGFTWRKYGQKTILRSRFPRSYFRCTHQKLYNCPAKKQVQRLDNDPKIFEITYRGDHTCHLSSTAPSVPPPPPPPPPSHHPLIHQQQLPLNLTPPQQQVLQWLSVAGPDAQHRGAFIGPTGSHIINLATAAVAAAGAASGAAPSSSRTAFGQEPSPINEYLQQHPQPVADMADAMFNSGGSSSNNSMDLIFPFMDDKWDSGEKKNKSNSSR